jgi:hypothetical protein
VLTFLTKDWKNIKYQNEIIIYSTLVLGRSVEQDRNGGYGEQQAVYE